MSITQPKLSRPVLVELFQSQGCSSCPPADTHLNALADATDVVALSFAVTYWDHLGWKDTYAKPAFTQRQWDYAHANHRLSVATPQVWVNGTNTLIGNRADELAAAIGGAHSDGPTITLHQGGATIGDAQAPVGGADIWLARFDPETRYVSIDAGENSGRTLPHRNIVHSLTRIGHWTGAMHEIALNQNDDGLRDAVFLQAGPGGPILAAARN
ncbi:DUF1223 domain-containing protein [Sphingobium chungangianum]